VGRISYSDYTISARDPENDSSGGINEMRILFVVAYFLPEIGSAAHVYYDLARAFIKKGHEVDILTSYPREYNLDKSDQSKQFPLDEVIDGIQVHRVKHLHSRDNIIIRGLEHFLLPGYYFKKYRQIGKKFDVCLFYIPPLPLYYLARRIKRYDGTLSVLNFQDFHPQELTEVGVLKNPLMIKILEYIERQAYKHADYITVLSHGGIEYVVQRGGNPDNISHIYNGILLSDSEKIVMKSDFKKIQKIEDKFLVSYTGILSPFQGIDNILDAARQLVDHPEIIFFIVGDGMIKTHLENRVSNEHITNVKLLPLQLRNEYYNIICSSDVNLISLDDQVKAPCFPGKTINLLAVKKPIIAIAGKDTETYSIMRTIDPYIVVEPNDPEKLIKLILKIKNNQELGIYLAEKGRSFFEDNMTLEKSVQSYEKVIAKIIIDEFRQAS
jgi:glycosyltransferase involved in cell wall biosynthesis